jgi:hypothetical protein
MDQNEKKDVNCNGLTYAEWIGKANARVVAKTGLSLDELTDNLSAHFEAWKDYQEPEDYADELIEEAETTSQEGYDDDDEDDVEEEGA